MFGVWEDFEKFCGEVYEECADPEWEIDNYPKLDLIERFPLEFCEWVNGLFELVSLQDAGYPFGKDDLDFATWKRLGILKQWRKNKNAETKSQGPY